MLDQRTRFRWLLAIGLALAPVCAAQDEKPKKDQEQGQHEAVWNLGTLESGKTYPTTVTAQNDDCKGKHDFELKFEGDATRFVSITGESILRDIGKGESKTTPARVDLTKMPAGTYNGGKLVSRCLDCSLGCNLDHRAIAIHLTVVDPG